MTTLNPMDDEAWLAHLAGKGASAGDARTELEAKRLREWFIRSSPASAEGAADAGLDQLLFRLRREGLLAKRTQSDWHRFMPVALAASVVLGVTMLIAPWQVNDIPPPETEAGPAPSRPAAATPSSSPPAVEAPHAAATAPLVTAKAKTSAAPHAAPAAPSVQAPSASPAAPPAAAPTAPAAPAIQTPAAPPAAAPEATSAPASAPKPRLRGTLDRPPMVVYANNIAAAMQEWRGALGRGEVTYTVRDERALSIDVPAQWPTEVALLLERERIAPPKSGRFVVEFRSRP